MLFDPSLYLKGLPLDYLVNFSAVESWFSKDYRCIKEKKKGVPDEVIKRIESYNKKIGAPSTVAENIEKLTEAAPVITGQQPCLLTGPLFVVYKALTAVILAEKYNTVPVFWNASEDDDIDEVNHVWVMNSNLEKIEVDLEKKPFSTIFVPEDTVKTVIESLKALTPHTEFRENILDIIGDSRVFSEMFSQVLSTLCSDYGLIMVEPHIFADLAIPVYETLIKQPLTASALVNKAGDSLEAHGYKRQLHKPENSCNFYVTDNTRHTVTYDTVFHVDKSTYTEKELLTLLYDHPEHFTSTVVSRPLIQDYLFLTLAYCAGPGEIAYFAQMKNVYQAFNIEEPFIVPRFGATIVEKKIKKIVDKYNIALPDLYDPDTIMKSLVKKDIAQFFNGKKEEILTVMQTIENYMGSIDINLQKTGAAMQTHVVTDLTKLEEKTIAAVKKQNRIMEAQIKKAAANIFPQNTLQERVINVFQYLIRYPHVVTTVYTTFQSGEPGTHFLITPGD